MTVIFLKLFNMSITASWIALAVIFLRLLLKRAPKGLTCIMWALVGLRLIFPFSIESITSLIPSAETVPQEIVYAEIPTIHSGVSFVNSAVNPIISTTFAPTPEAGVNPMQIITSVAAVVWVVGMAVMLLYTAVSYLRIKLKVREAIRLKDNIMLCDRVSSPFILGVIRPRIYLPSDTAPSDTEYIIAHEMAHLKRRDHLWKPLGFLLLTVYWFNPVLWIAYILLCRDIELACDEKVIRHMGTDIKKPYSEALINCSASRRMISACPLAFGEVGVKGRIKAVLNYKKPAFWIIILALISCIVLAVCFLTDPKDEEETEEPPYFALVSQESSSELKGVWAEITETDFQAEAPTMTVVWHNDSEYELVFGEEFYIYRDESGEYTDTRTYDNYAYNTIGYPILQNGTFEKTYNLWGIEISEAGKYRYVTNCLIDGSNPVPDGLKKYDVIIDFEIDRGADNSGTNTPNSDDTIPSDLVCTITKNCIIPDSNEMLTDVDGSLARELYATLLSIHTSAEMAELPEGTDEADYLQLVFRRSSGTDYDPTSSMLYTMDYGIYIVFENDYINYSRSMYQSATYSFKAPDGTYEKIKEMILLEEVTSPDETTPDESDFSEVTVPEETTSIPPETEPAVTDPAVTEPIFDKEPTLENVIEHTKKRLEIKGWTDIVVFDGEPDNTMYWGGLVIAPYELASNEKLTTVMGKGTYQLSSRTCEYRVLIRIVENTQTEEASVVETIYPYRSMVYPNVLERFLQSHSKTDPLLQADDRDLAYALTSDTHGYDSFEYYFDIPSYNETYACTKSPEQFTPMLYLNTKNGTFSFPYSMFSSYLAVGHYEWTDTQLILRTDDGMNTYVFNITGESELVKGGASLTLNTEESTPLPKYKYSEDAAEAVSPISDDAVFNCVRKAET